MRTNIVLGQDWELCRASEWGDDLSLLLTGHAGEGRVFWHEVSVPTGVHEVLLRDGQISDPHIGKNAADSNWVGEEDWAFRRRFVTPSLSEGAVFLTFLGVDTLADAYLNGTHIQSFDNMFREYIVPVRELLVPEGEENVLVVVIRSPSRYVREHVSRPAEHRDSIPPHFYIRKGGGDFGSYLGARPQLVKVGIYRDVVLSVNHGSWLDDVRARTTSLQHGKAELDVEAIAGGQRVGRYVWALTDPDGAVAAEGAHEAAVSSWTIEVADPQLWWPRSHGPAPLYRLEVVLLGESGEPLDRREVRIGLRDIQFVRHDPETGEERFGFVVNGVPIYLKGANWAQVEGISNVWDSKGAQRLLDLAELAGMNVLRVWGGGVIPEDEFYQECDRRGFLVWQDFMLEYGMYPTDQKSFAETLEVEMVGMVRRLRNHPSIFLWCGGNESHMGWDFKFGGDPEIGAELFLETMPRICAEFDGTRPFHANSPYGGSVANWPLSGDWHDYTTLTYSHRSSVPTFVSEMGRVSAPSLASMKRFLSEEQLWPAGHDASIREPGQESWPPMWGYRAPDGAWDKIGPIEEFCEPSSAEDYIRVLGTAHGEYLRRSVERHRRGRPNGNRGTGRRNWGDMVWRLNDPWPILYWSVIDSYLEPKIPYYFLRRAYAPVLVSFEQSPDELAVWVTNDSTGTVRGRLRVERRTFDGTLVAEMGEDAEIAPGESRRILETAALGPIPLRTEFLRATYLDQEVTWLLMGERYLHLPTCSLDVEASQDTLTVTTDNFARQVTLEKSAELEDAILDDNYFDLGPGESRTVAIRGAAAPGEIKVSALNAADVRGSVGPSAGDVAGPVHPRA